MAKCPICNHIFNGDISRRNMTHILKYQVSGGFVKVEVGPDGKRRYQLTEKGVRRVERKFHFLPDDVKRNLPKVFGDKPE